MLWYFSLCSLRSCKWVAPPVVLACRIVELMWDATVLHSDLFPEFPCDSELIPVKALSTKRVQLLWCSGCGTETSYAPDCEWVWVVYPGMKLDLKV